MANKNLHTYLHNNINGINVQVFSCFVQSFGSKIVKGDFFGIAIMERYITVYNHDMLNSKPAIYIFINTNCYAQQLSALH